MIPKILRRFASTPFKDYYAILGIKTSADGEAIKSAYRTLAKKYHPDVNANATEAKDGLKFREISEAYAILSVRETRLEYDARRQVHLPPEPQKERDKTGHVTQPINAGSFANVRMQELQDERKRFNVNYYGFYMGGLPQQGKGKARQGSKGAPYTPHDPHLHNEDEETQDIYTMKVDAREAMLTNNFFEANKSEGPEEGWKKIERDSYHRMKRDRFSTSNKMKLCILTLILYELSGHIAELYNKIYRRIKLPNLNPNNFLFKYGVVMKKEMPKAH